MLLLCLIQKIMASLRPSGCSQITRRLRTQRVGSSFVVLSYGVGSVYILFKCKPCIVFKKIENRFFVEKPAILVYYSNTRICSHGSVFILICFDIDARGENISHDVVSDFLYILSGVFVVFPLLTACYNFLE